MSTPVPTPVPNPRHRRPAAMAHPAAAPDTIGDQLTRLASRHPGWLALDAASDQLACGLMGLKLQRGDCIAVVGLERPESLVLLSAAAKLGVVVVDVSLRCGDAATAMVLVHSQARAVFSPLLSDGIDAIALLQRLGARSPMLRHVIPTDGSGLNSLAALAATPLEAGRLSAARRRVSGDDVALLVYSVAGGQVGGQTSARPEATTISHRSLLAKPHHSNPSSTSDGSNTSNLSDGSRSQGAVSGWAGWGRLADSAAGAGQHRPHPSPR